jgi:diadenosine tetraphosphate (Ap4A) HIT family hydrolase
MPKRLILKDFELTEISGVDRPAQTPATMSIIKRKNEEPDMSAEELKDLQKKVQELTASLEIAKSMANLSDDEKQYTNGMDDEAKKNFANLKPDERKAHMEMSKRAQEVIEINGTLINKAAVGDDMFEVLKSQQEQINKQAIETRKARDLAIQATFVKKASDEFPHLPGTSTEVGTLLRETADLSKGAQNTLSTILKALDKMNSSAFVSKGHGGGNDEGESAVEKLDKLAKSYSEKHNVDYASAYSTVIEQNAALYEEIIN